MAIAGAHLEVNALVNELVLTLKHAWMHEVRVSHSSKECMQ